MQIPLFLANIWGYQVAPDKNGAANTPHNPIVTLSRWQAVILQNLPWQIIKLSQIERKKKSPYLRKPKGIGQSYVCMYVLGS